MGAQESGWRDFLAVIRATHRIGLEDCSGASYDKTDIQATVLPGVLSVVVNEIAKNQFIKRTYAAFIAALLCLLFNPPMQCDRKNS